VLAVRAEKTTRKAAVYTRDVLRSVGARLLGVVVNDVPRRKSVYGYYYSDSQVYAYGYGHRTNGRSNGSSNGSSNGNGSAKASGNGSSASTSRTPAPAKV